MELYQCLLDFPRLADSALLRDVDPEWVRGIRGDCSRCFLEAGRVLIQAGHSNTSLFLVLEGRLRVHLRPGSRPLFLLEPGDFVGEVSLFDGGAASATVVADSPCQLLRIPGSVVWSMVEPSPVARNLVSILASRLRQKNDLLLTGQGLLDEYQRHATTDSLTGLHNRRWLDEVLLRQLDRSRRERSPCSLLLIDVDGLKGFNDEHGHLAGDRILQGLARALERNLRPGEMVARFGGDEFIVLLPDTDGSIARRIAKRLCRAVAASAPGSPNLAGTLTPTISIGVAELGPSDDPQELLSCADRSLYHAKREGGNRAGPLPGHLAEGAPRPGSRGFSAPR